MAQYTKDGDLVKIWDSIVDVTRELGIDSSTIGKVCKGTNQHRHTAGGFVWKYVGNYYFKEK